jgi:hypothetical protein
MKKSLKSIEFTWTGVVADTAHEIAQQFLKGEKKFRHRATRFAANVHGK